MKTNSIFDYSPKVEELPPEKMPTMVNKTFREGGKIITKSVPRKKKCI